MYHVSLLHVLDASTTTPSNWPPGAPPACLLNGRHEIHEEGAVVVYLPIRDETGLCDELNVVSVQYRQ